MSGFFLPRRTDMGAFKYIFPPTSYPISTLSISLCVHTSQRTVHIAVEPMQNSGFTAEQPKKKSVQIQSLILNPKKKKN